jgi:hypothetical protein
MTFSAASSPSFGWQIFNMAEAHVRSAYDAISTAAILREVFRRRRLR